MSKDKIKRIFEDGKVKTYSTIEAASKDVDTRYENWKVQLMIVNAINTRTRAFKCTWEKIS